MVEFVLENIAPGSCIHPQTVHSCLLLGLPLGFAYFPGLEEGKISILRTQPVLAVSFQSRPHPLAEEFPFFSPRVSMVCPQKHFLFLDPSGSLRTLPLSCLGTGASSLLLWHHHDLESHLAPVSGESTFPRCWVNT